MVVEKIIVLAKTYPELSTKYGPLICVAGVNEYGEWRRLYPVPLKIWLDEEYKDIRFRKWDVIEVEVSNKPPQHDRRHESRKVLNWRNIKIIRHIGSWSKRLTIINEILDPSIEFIRESGRSLGVIRPTMIVDFFAKPRRRLREEAERIVLKKMDDADSIITLYNYLEIGDKHLLPEVTRQDTKIKELPWIGYKFYCANPRCNGHEMMVIDWEAQELFRKYGQIEGPVKKKLFDEFRTERNLYFIIGNTWRYHKSFMIIGLFYPPKNVKPEKPIVPIFKKKPPNKTLNDFLSHG